VKSNAWFLGRLLEREEFAIGKVTTGFIAEHEADLTAAPKPSLMLLQEVAERLIFDGWNGTSEWVPRTLDRERGLIGFRLNAEPNTRVVVYRDNVPQAINYDLELYDSASSYEVSTHWVLGGADAMLAENGAQFTFTRSADIGRASHTADGAILSPMPGKVIAVDVTEGEAVVKGQRLLVLEAMKMEHALTAPFDGTVAELTVAEGQQVQVEALLARVEKADS